MQTILIWSLLLLQGLPIQKTGTISGVLRNEDGKPAVGVRVTAMPQLDSLLSDTGPTMSSLAETDSQGRFTLENVPPGRYYVTAGRLDFPTYYPGTPSMALGKTVQVTPGNTVGNVDFVLGSSSTGRAEPAGFGSNASLTLLDVPINVVVEGGGKLPVFSKGQATNGQFTTITLTGTNGAALRPIPIQATRTSLTPPLTDYAITIEGLPEGYSVKSVKYGSTELPDRILRVTSLVGPTPSLFGSNTTTPALGNRASGIQLLSIVLDSAAARSAQTTGRTVRGKMNSSAPRAVHLSGSPGTMFSDGSFEFRNVERGRHLIMTRDNTPASPALAALVIVADQDLENVPLQPTPVLPRDWNLTLRQPSKMPNGGVVPLPSLEGKILDAETGSAVSAGTIYLVGESWVPLQLGAEGKFDFRNLLPGTYEVEVQAIGYPTLRREIVIGEQDVQLDLKVG